MSDQNMANVLDLKLGTLIAAIRQKRLNITNVHQSRKKSASQRNSPVAVFEHRFQAQREIIENFKLTVDKQEKIIKQLQMENVALENELLGLREQMKSKSDEDFKKDVDGITNKINGLKSPLFNVIRVKTPEVLIRMNKREEERKKRRKQLNDHKELKERRKLEEEILREEESRRKQLEIAKFKKQEAISKRQAEEETNRRTGRLRIFAIFFYEKFASFSFFERWKMSVLETRHRAEFCARIVTRVTVIRTLKGWKLETNRRKARQELEERERRVRLLECRYFSRWKTKYLASKILERQAEWAYGFEKFKHFILSWQLYCLHSQVRREEKCVTAREGYQRGLHRRYFSNWRDYPKLMYEEREKEKRIRQWHSSIQQLILDFNV